MTGSQPTRRADPPSFGMSARSRAARPGLGAGSAVAEERRNAVARERLVQRIQGEFSEMRGLHLTFAQATRLFGLRSDICSRVLACLIRDGYLCCESTGQYRLRERVS